jgi:spore coat protein A
MTSRRKFLQVSAAVGVGSLMRWQIDSRDGSLFKAARALAASGQAQTPLAGSIIARDWGQFVQPLPTFGARRVSDPALQVGMVEFQQKVLPDRFYAQLSAPTAGQLDGRAGTYVWGYQVGSTAPSYPASTIVARRGVPTFVKYVNSLPLKPYLQKLLTVDQTVHFADPLGQMGALGPYGGPVPGVVHLHGAEVQSAYDGVPDGWWTADGKRGKAYSTMMPTDPNAAIYHYPNRQPATTLWFHDHALGMTRINVLSGLCGMYLVRDQYDTGLANNPLGLPAGDQEVELVLQDRQFDTNGQWYFPDGSEPDPLADPPQVLNGDPPNPAIHPFWVPEFFGDTIVVNGRTWPFLEVEPRRYRFRVVNGSNARFFRMALADSTTNAAGPLIWQIGSDGGLLDRPVKPTDHENVGRLALFLAPGERADIIVDFTGRTGRTFTLTNDAQYPFPSGGPVAPGLDDRVMQFRVTKQLSSRDTTFDPASGAPLRGGANQPRPVVRLSNPTTGAMASGVTSDLVRQLVLVEVAGPGGPVEVLLNNTTYTGRREGTTEIAGGSGARPDGAGNYATEQPRLGATEVWEILNLTQDAHPIHLHLIQFQLRNRQAVTSTTDADGSALFPYRDTYDAKFPGGKYAGLQADNSTWGPVTYTAATYIPGFGPPQPYATPNADGAVGGNPAFKPFLTGPIIVPEASEVGWKDTIKAYPGQVTRIVARWTPQETPIGSAGPGQNAFPFDPTSGPGYVWHCHILDHEDNEMMRPLKPVS